MIIYEKLWEFLDKKNMKRTDLLQVVSSPTLAKLGKNENINVKVIAQICNFLNCQPSDIMENVETEEEILKIQQFKQATNTMCESLYALLLKLSDNSDKTLHELWNEYLNTLSEKKKNSADFQIMKRYIENRIAENENE